MFIITSVMIKFDSLFLTFRINKKFPFQVPIVILSVIMGFEVTSPLYDYFRFIHVCSRQKGIFRVYFEMLRSDVRIFINNISLKDGNNKYNLKYHDMTKKTRDRYQSDRLELFPTPVDEVKFCFTHSGTTSHGIRGSIRIILEVIDGDKSIIGCLS